LKPSIIQEEKPVLVPLIDITVKNVEVVKVKNALLELDEIECNIDEDVDNEKYY
jgi:hypothetical protein